MIRDDLLLYLNSLRKPEPLDPESPECWKLSSI
jgi:hypothetical protein